MKQKSLHNTTGKLLEASHACSDMSDGLLSLPETIFTRVCFDGLPLLALLALVRSNAACVPCTTGRTGGGGCQVKSFQHK